MRVDIPGLTCCVVTVLAGCAQPPWGRYDIPLKEARARLEKADVTGFRNARECGFLIHFTPFRPGEQSSGWLITSGGRTVVRFHVTLATTETGVQATIVVPPGKNGGEMYDGRQDYDYPVFMQPLRPALEELVDSAMGQRPFDWRRLPDPLNVGPNDTLSNCINSRGSLDGGVAWSMDDPPGMSHADAIRLGLRRE
jgi:hypothetical protein